MIFHITGGPCLVPVRLSQPDNATYAFTEVDSTINKTPNGTHCFQQVQAQLLIDEAKLENTYLRKSTTLFRLVSAKVQAHKITCSA